MLYFCVGLKLYWKQHYFLPLSAVHRVWSKVRWSQCESFHWLVDFGLLQLYLDNNNRELSTLKVIFQVDICAYLNPLTQITGFLKSSFLESQEQSMYINYPEIKRATNIKSYATHPLFKNKTTVILKSNIWFKHSDFSKSKNTTPISIKKNH